MTPDLILQQLKLGRAMLSATSDTLGVKPQSVVTPELRASIPAHKATLIADVLQRIAKEKALFEARLTKGMDLLQGLEAQGKVQTEEYAKDLAFFENLLRKYQAFCLDPEVAA